MTPLGVLDGENAQCLPGAQYRHAEEGIEFFFAGFRAIGKAGMAGRIIETERLCLGGDETHQPFAQTQRGQMHRFGLEALGGEEFERAVVAQHIERADIGPHVLGDEGDDLVETSLRRQGLRHRLAQLPQEHPRAAYGRHHRLVRQPAKPPPLSEDAAPACARDQASCLSKP